MDEIAEQGFAAHWKYKSDSDTEKVAEDELNGWLQTIKEILDDPQPDAMDFLDAIKLNLFASEIFVFSPKGDIITMPANCTALDYAFQIHTFLGAHCIGAKVNHKLVPLSHKLKSGDQIEIITNNSQKVQPAWLNFVTTAKARTKLQTLLRKQDREYAKKGEETLQVWLEQNGLTLSTSNLDKLTEAHRMKHHDQLFIAIAKGDIVLGQKDIDYIYYGAKGADNAKKRKDWRRYIPFVRSMQKAVVKGHEYLTVGKDFDKTQIIEITDENISKYVFPKCCQPIPGDEIIAYVNKKNQIEIHQRSCAEAARLQSSFGSNILVAKWSMSGSMEFRATLALRGIDRKGIIRDVSLVLAGTFDIDIHRMSTLSDDGIFNSEIELKVKDSIALGEVEEQLRQIDGMQSVHRI
jgi:GTP pyrophosphokinase